MKEIKNINFLWKIKYWIKSKFGNTVFSYLLIFQRVVAHPIYQIRMRALLRKYVVKAKEEGTMSRKDILYWKSNFKLMIASIYEEKRVKLLIPAFFGMSIEKVKVWENDTQNGNEPVVICAIKDDLARIKEIKRYYEDVLKVCRFAFIDNGSSDGTFEYLVSQKNCAVYRTLDNFDSRKKTMWLNYVMKDLSNDKGGWFLVIDSDECFSYPGYENVTLRQFVQKLVEEHCKCIKAYMVEFYPKTDVLNENDKESFIKKYNYFDSDSEFYIYDPIFASLKGGLHARAFGQTNAIISKTPLFYFEKGRFLLGPHNILPLKDDIMDGDFRGILKHYKFISTDKDKILKIVEQQNYANGSRLYKEYKKVLIDEGKQSLYNKNSESWEGTISFQKLPLIK